MSTSVDDSTNGNSKEEKSSSSALVKKKANINPQKVMFWAAECKYSVILDQVKNSGWKATENEKKEQKCNVFWVDVALIHERFRNVQPWQIVNHIPGMNNIARKNRMAQHLNKMHKLFPIEYSFYPRTWVLPQDMTDFKVHLE
jgi:hypothetical protein